MLSNTGPRIPSRQEMVDAKVPLHYRDTCAGLVIPLNECRRETLFLPWKCQDLRHAYEKCQYMEYVAHIKLIAFCLLDTDAFCVCGSCRWKKRVEILKNAE